VGLRSNHALGFTTNDTERMRIDSSGNVGIGTTAPQGLLHVVAGTDNSILIRGPINYATGGSIYAVNAANSVITPMEFGASSYFFAGGNVGIGTSSPVQKLQVHGSDGNDVYTRISNTDSGTSAGLLLGLNGNEEGIVRVEPNKALIFGTNNTERMRIDSAGNVGIGTTAPSFAKLQVSNAGAEGFEFSPALSAGVNRILSYNRTTSAWNTLRLEGSSQQFYVSGTERMRVDSSGNVGVGTSAPSYTFQVNALSGSNNVAYFVNDSVGSTLAGIVASIESGGNNTNSFHFAGVTQTVALWYLYGNGTTSYTSDIRVKKNVETTRDGYLEDVCKLRVVKYNWYNDSDDTPRELGFIAQEVEQVFPGLVQDALHPTKDGEIHKVLKGSVMMPIMLKALQEANAKIDALTARVAQLEGN